MGSLELAMQKVREVIGKVDIQIGEAAAKLLAMQQEEVGEVGVERDPLAGEGDRAGQRCLVLVPR